MADSLKPLLQILQGKIYMAVCPVTGTQASREMGCCNVITELLCPVTTSLARLCCVSPETRSVSICATDRSS